MTGSRGGPHRRRRCCTSTGVVARPPWEETGRRGAGSQALEGRKDTEDLTKGPASRSATSPYELVTVVFAASWYATTGGLACARAQGAAGRLTPSNKNWGPTACKVPALGYIQGQSFPLGWRRGVAATTMGWRGSTAAVTRHWVETQQCLLHRVGQAAPLVWVTLGFEECINPDHCWAALLKIHRVHELWCVGAGSLQEVNEIVLRHGQVVREKQVDKVGGVLVCLGGRAGVTPAAAMAALRGGTSESRASQRGSRKARRQRASIATRAGRRLRASVRVVGVYCSDLCILFNSAKMTLNQQIQNVWRFRNQTRMKETPKMCFVEELKKNEPEALHLGIVPTWIFIWMFMNGLNNQSSIFSTPFKMAMNIQMNI